MINIIICFVLIIGIIEIIRYKKYYLKYKLLNDIKIEEALDNKYILEFFRDLRKYPDILETYIKDLYYSKKSLEEINNRDVCEGFFDIIHNDSKYIDNIKEVITNIKKMYHSKNIYILDSKTYNNRIKWHKDKLISVFDNFIMCTLRITTQYITNMYLSIIGYKLTISENGINIWINKYNVDKGIPIIFFNCISYDINYNKNLLFSLNKHFNIILIDISFLKISNMPQSMNNIISNVHNFLEKKYNILNNINKYNMMGIGLGANICANYINYNSEYIDKLFVIEGHIFIADGLKIFYTKNEKYDQNLYAQYFINKQFNIDKSFLYGLTDFDKPIDNDMYIKEKISKGIYLFFYNIDPCIQIKYANRKRIPIKYFILKNKNLDNTVQYIETNFLEYIIETILDIYEESKNKFIQ